MLTVRNEFETIEAFTNIAGSSFGNQTDRETTAELIAALDTVTQYDTSKLWRELAECSDDNSEVMFDLQRYAADVLNEYAPIASYTTVDLVDNEWIVAPYLDDELPRLSDIPDNCVGDHILVVNDHGNVSCMYWDYSAREYKTVWAMV